MTRRLVARPLDARAFAPFGTVIEVPVAAAGRPINAGSSERFDLVDDLALDAAGGRGAIAVARPAWPARWEWFSDLMPTIEDVGDIWLEVLHLSRDATLTAHWQTCTGSVEWFTQANRYCRADHWPGCGPAARCSSPTSIWTI